MRHFIRFILAKLAVGSCMELMTAIFAICGGIINTVMGSVGGSISTAATLPTEIVTAVESLGLLESIPLWLVSLLSSLFITIMSFILLLTSMVVFSGCTCIQHWRPFRWRPLQEKELPPAVKHF